VVLACHAPKPAPLVHLEQTAVDVPATRVVEVGDTAFAFGERGVWVLRNDVVLSRGECASPPCAWGDAAAIAAPTGEGRWAVAILGDKLVHVTMSAELEDVGERLGLREPPRRIAAAGHTFAALGDKELAVTRDGMHLMRFPIAEAPALAVARDRLALARPDRIELWDLAAMTSRTIPLGHASIGFLDADSERARLVASGDTGTFVEAVGPMQRLGGRATIATAGSRLWLFAMYEHWRYSDGHTVVQATEGGLANAAGSSSGALWVFDGQHMLRYSPDRPTDDPAWQTNIAPVFARVCAHCHVPGGEAGIDLSTPASWRGERDEIRRRVLVTNTMPPAGTNLTDEDRASIAAWLSRIGANRH
jgi:mono/diheme cytochrome c family protein